MDTENTNKSYSQVNELVSTVIQNNKDIDALNAELELIKAERDKYKYVPGIMRCAKCPAWEIEAKRAFWAGFESAIAPRWNEYIAKRKGEINNKPNEAPKNKPSSVAEFLAMADELIDSNPYTYVEIAHTRATGWMVWLREKPDGELIADGQGETMEEACAGALAGMQAHDD